MRGAVSPLMLVAIASLLLVTAAAWLFLLDRRSRSLDLRVTGVLSAYAPAVQLRAPATSTWHKKFESAASIEGTLSFLKIDLRRPDLYPAPWPVLLIAATVFTLIATGATEFLTGPAAWIGAPLIWCGAARSLFGHFRTRRTKVLYTQLPDALAMIVRSVRAGIPVPEALRIVGEEGQWPTSTEFVRLYEEIKLGGSLPDALIKLAQRSSLAEYRFFAVAMSLQSQSGGSLAETLENLGDVVRKRVALRQRAIALASEARMTMWTLAVLPFVAGAGLTLMSPGYVLLLVTTAAGKKVLFVGLGLLAMGIGSMKLIIAKSVS